MDCATKVLTSGTAVKLEGVVPLIMDGLEASMRRVYLVERQLDLSSVPSLPHDERKDGDVCVEVPLT